MKINEFDKALQCSVMDIALFGELPEGYTEEEWCGTIDTFIDMMTVLDNNADMLKRAEEAEDIDELIAELNAEAYAIRMELAEFVATYGPEV